ncbi:MAG TPA: type II toxin-antitoxin system RelE/ParE family toxin [Longimicrobium sp.]|nr:type II toxin-antitoxin system RelE/ParE family toxin [Longimicrobium sp.]
MEIEYDDDDLRRLEFDKAFTGGYSPAIVSGFRRLIQFIRASSDERDFRAMRGFRFERLKGKREHEYSMRINKQWRLVFEIRGQAPRKQIGVKGIEDYH